MKTHDYAGGWYFVTLCTENRACLFGKVENDAVVLNPMGELARQEWQRGAELRGELTLDAFVVMPNHLHAILSLSGGRVGHRPTPTREGADLGKSGTLGAVISQFKSVTTKAIRKVAGSSELQIWQRYYYDHIVRDDSDLLRIQTYIKNNPLKWALDRENPDRTGEDEDDSNWYY